MHNTPYCNNNIANHRYLYHKSESAYEREKERLTKRERLSTTDGSRGKGEGLARGKLWILVARNKL